MDCPKCNSKNHVKNGTYGGGQRFRCKDCNATYSALKRWRPLSMKKFALEMYLEGTCIRSIGRLLKVSHCSVINWIREFGKRAARETELTRPAPIIEMDELFTFIGGKKTNIGFGRQSIGSRKSLSDSGLGRVESGRATSCMRK